MFKVVCKDDDTLINIDGVLFIELWGFGKIVEILSKFSPNTFNCCLCSVLFIYPLVDGNCHGGTDEDR